jgi:DNA polymerase III delta prime subunit
LQAEHDAERETWIRQHRAKTMQYAAERERNEKTHSELLHQVKVSHDEAQKAKQDLQANILSFEVRRARGRV